METDNSKLVERLDILPLEEDIIDEFTVDIIEISRIQPKGAPSPKDMADFNYLDFVKDNDNHLREKRKRGNNSTLKTRYNFIEFISMILKTVIDQDNKKLLKYLYNILIY